MREWILDGLKKDVHMGEKDDDLKERRMETSSYVAFTVYFT